MNDVLADFHRLIAEHGTEASRSPTAGLLQAMPADAAEQLRLCAIPHEFDKDTLRVLSPGLGLAEAEERLREFEQLSCVIPAGRGLALHETTRNELFAAWLQPARIERFRDTSRALCAHLDARIETSDEANREELAFQRMFHLLGADSTLGFAEFERQSYATRREGRLVVAAALIKLVHEYDPVLASAQKAWVALHEARLAADQHRWTEAKSLYRLVLDQPVQTEVELAANAHLGLGDLAGECGDYRQAIDHYGAALRLLPPTGFLTIKEHDVFRSLGEAYRDSGQMGEAEDMLRRSITVAEAAGDQLSIADTYNSLGTLWLTLGDVDKAASSYHRSLECLERNGHRFQCAQVLNNLGLLHAQHADWDEAMHAYERSLQIKQQAGDTLGTAKTLLNVTQVHLARDDIERGLITSAEAIRLFDEMRSSSGLARAKLLYGRSLLHKDAKEALRVLEEAAVLFERCGALSDAAQARQFVANISTPARTPWWCWGCLVAIFVCIVGTVVFILWALKMS